MQKAQIQISNLPSDNSDGFYWSVEIERRNHAGRPSEIKENNLNENITTQNNMVLCLLIPIKQINYRQEKCWHQKESIQKVSQSINNLI
ncbi:hypothetical protein PoB_002132000 [Plakobranchus ocellatus]|uniref:Uncharacterized protein n=1 Tax=Plakobranchus ocellatus TaxID=259542 RepID=A0AAV3ZI62_9GAST|nr:hypothetical protein PoB_002132000 [Plakobranchus ocellatus]